MKLQELPFLDSPVPAVEFDAVVSDSRLVTAGCIFAAVPGTNRDGAAFVPAAVASGACAVLCSREARARLADAGVALITAPDVREAMAQLAAFAEGRPSERLKVFAVTGTNGKTSVAWLLARMLETGGLKTGLQSTVAVEYCGKSFSSARTTPGACEFQRLLAQMRDAGCEAVVTEASSHALDQRRLAAVRLSGGIFTNLTEDHLDYHGTMEAYFDAKKKLFLQLAQDRPGAPAVVFMNAPGGVELAEWLQELPLRTLKVGIGEEECGFFLRAAQLKMDNGWSKFTLCHEGRAIKIRTALAGRHNVANLLCAGAMALATGVEFEVVAAVMNDVRPRWGRLERVESAVPFSVFVDYAHTDDALRNVLSALRETTRGKIIVVFGCGGDRDRAKRPLMGAACAAGADFLVVTSDNPRSEDPQAIIDEILPGIPDSAKYLVEPDRHLAIVKALECAEAGDAVLIAGKGHETEQIGATGAVHFDDREEARAALKKIETKFKS